MAGGGSNLEHGLRKCALNWAAAVAAAANEAFG